MKRKDMQLDFTSLLDVTMIILFFFVLFSSLETETLQQQAEAQTAAAQQVAEAAQLEAAEAKAQAEQDVAAAEQRAEEAAEQAAADRDETERLRHLNTYLAEQYDAMSQFRQGENLKLFLRMDVSGTWRLLVYEGEEYICRITSEDDTEAAIRRMLKQQGYTVENTMLCDFLYTGTEPGTAAAFRSIEAALTAVQTDYRYFYYSLTDLSLGKDEPE